MACCLSWVLLNDSRTLGTWGLYPDDENADPLPAPTPYGQPGKG